jgi:NADPH:quinone reductase-like Zn-dependent oxidoreductase
MKAVRINEWGKPVQVEDLPDPSPAADEVLVRVRAASVNPVDRAIASGYLKMIYSTPLTLGIDFSGEVAAVGAKVQHVKSGDAVFGASTVGGTFAEYAVVKATGVAPKPQTLDDVQAAAAPLTGLSAWQTLFKLARLKAGERILIHGAGGGIGTMAVQLAKNAGAYVIAHDHGKKGDFLRSLGADEFINAETQRFEDEVSDLDVILDLVGNELVERSWAVCQPGTRYITTAARIDPEEAAKRGINATDTLIQPNVDELAGLSQELEASKVKVFVSKTFPLAEAQEALHYHSNDAGKVVITVG